MSQEKVGASRHNARAAFNDNSLSGSNQALPALLTGGGVSISSNSVNELVDSPPTIKRRTEEPCYYGKPCSDLWNTHSRTVDLKRHLHYLFGIDWPVISKLFGIYGVDHVNQNIHNTREFIEKEFAAGRKIKKSLAHCFMYCMSGVDDSEPELSPEAAAERDVTVTAGIDALRAQKKKKPRNDSSKYLDEYNRRRGGL